MSPVSLVTIIGGSLAGVVVSGKEVSLCLR
jgi:hypothetical protein